MVMTYTRAKGERSVDSKEWKRTDAGDFITSNANSVGIKCEYPFWGYCYLVHRRVRHLYTFEMVVMHGNVLCNVCTKVVLIFVTVLHVCFNGFL